MRNIGVIAVASHHPSWAAEAEAHYLRQMRFFRLNIIALKNNTSIEKEAEAILSRLPNGGRYILLDRLGETMTGDTFSTTVSGWIEDTRSLTFVIAGATGAAKSLRTNADKILSLSSFVFPHTLARLILVEQLFRTDCQMRNHPYPR